MTPGPTVSPLQKFMDKVQSGSPQLQKSAAKQPTAALAVPKLNLKQDSKLADNADTKETSVTSKPSTAPPRGVSATTSEASATSTKPSPMLSKTPQPGQLMERVMRLEQETAESARLEQVLLDSSETQ